MSNVSGYMQPMSANSLKPQTTANRSDPTELIAEMSVGYLGREGNVSTVLRADGSGYVVVKRNGEVIHRFEWSEYTREVK